MCLIFLRQPFFFGAALSVVSVRIENKCAIVFEGDCDPVAGLGALVKLVELRVRIVVGNLFADGLPRRLDELEGVDVERWFGGRRDVDDPSMSLQAPPFALPAAAYVRSASNSQSP